MAAAPPGRGGGVYGLAQLYADAARSPSSLPEGGHTAAIRERPEDYERRVIASSTTPSSTARERYAKEKGTSMFAKYRRDLATWHYRLFLGGLAVMLFHLTEDALVHKENGSSLAAQLGSTALNLLLVAIGALLYPLLWRRVRPLFVLLYGALALLTAWRAHVSDVLDGDAAGGDYSGTVYALTGLVLIGLALKLAVDSFRDRSAPAAEGSSGSA